MAEPGYRRGYKAPLPDRFIFTYQGTGPGFNGMGEITLHTR